MNGSAPVMPANRRAMSQGVTSPPGQHGKGRDRMRGPSLSDAQRDRDRALRSVSATLGSSAAPAPDRSASVPADMPADVPAGAAATSMSELEVEKKSIALTEEFLGIHDTKVGAAHCFLLFTNDAVTLQN